MPGCSNCPSDTAIASQGADPLFRRVLWIALIANAVMFVVEIIASQLGNSISLQADALDFFGDAANYAISLFVLGMALHLRARASLIKGATMAAFGIWVIGNAVYRAVVGSAPDASVMGAVAILALAVNVAVSILLYRYREGDSNMRSIWLCSRNDAIGNIAVMVAAAGVFATTSRWPDLIVAAIISGLNLSAAFHVIRLALSEIRTGGSDSEREAPQCKLQMETSVARKTLQNGID
ncbi:cation diffusion facilitator family transporter [SAR92 clade bacterium H455]|uniref:Cation diffusion facilitator family transporter n=1 Tax=SAR92 clade bacterium H455 TaxID=2974818 RepID=A0ABY5TTA8_9GAMM|nr:cation diffusion facilitator family transporter [SAR92 clade bacterium H455]